jgi:hypothetical protein
MGQVDKVCKRSTAHLFTLLPLNIQQPAGLKIALMTDGNLPAF